MIGTLLPFKMPQKIKKTKVVVIVGPTASGKSDLAVSIAKKFNGEVVSADSRQVYRGMDIGTGKISKREMKGVRHHLLDITDPNKRFNADNYRALARAAIDDIVARGKLPIICGGTGFYIDAILKDDPFPNVPPNPKLRKKLAKKTAPQLLLILKKLDSKRAEMISKSDSEKKNARRIIRAIEIACARKNGMEGQRVHRNRRAAEATILTWTKVPSFRQKYSTVFIGIKPDRDELRKRIHTRLMKRISHGMIDEARRLHKNGLSWKRMDELGLEYRYLAKYLQGKMEKEEMVGKLNTEIWHYVRRQMTWWKRNKKIQWFTPQNVKSIKNKVTKILD
jgi:tRNA dimethylallyltransferase